MTGAPLASSLLFCLFSLLFGVGMAVLYAVLLGALAALRLLPPVVKREKRAGDAPREAEPVAEAVHAKQPHADAPPRQTTSSAVAPAPSSGAKGKRDPRALAREDAAKPAVKKTRTYFLGHLLCDLLSFLLFAVLYLLFLFLTNGGVLRLHSLLLVGAGFLAAYRAARLLVARPVFLVLSFPIFLLGRAARLFLRPLRRIFRMCRRKKPKQLDETDKMV